MHGKPPYNAPHAGAAATAPGKLGWRWKRTAAAALLLLVGGAIVNVAVAWSVRFVIREDPTLVKQGNPRETTLYLVSVDLRRDDGQQGVFLIHRVSSRLDDYIRRGIEVSALTLPNRYEADEFAATLPPASWFTLVRDSASRHRLANLRVRAEYTSGWPFAALRYRERYVNDPDLPWSDDTTSVVVGGVSLRQWVDDQRHGMPLPVTPVLPGFVVNTLFYAVVFSLLFFAPFTARRMLRRRRGQCEKCAYPIGVSPVCTECGAAVRPLVARSS